ncbi:DNA-processing protein DprA [Aquabacterium sp. A7-Y]|uniref:DNA-processing protein DprA n=1 Tax=Aquabacterium sp. A7-Y TaxID=1349605 RepID=UPI00223CD545|nr:DNA-processing protein DprA [Aquabacterium sp. A7-Y]MCW7539320.1 DNA-processing protein DprA [Aquabacterium sp. A7-Y]
MERRELAAWLRLIATPGVGGQTARRLLALAGSPEAVFEAPVAAWREALDRPQAQALVTPPARLDTLVETTWQWLQDHDEHHLLCLGDPRYPELLLSTDDPPLLLHAQGRLELLRADSIAVVGSRNPTCQGVDNARAFAAHLSRAGLTVVSGLALGIDGAAHEGGLQGPGSTIAVVGTGLDRVYPARHRALAHRIAEQGLLLSEYLLGTPPLAPNFPRRNRLISGLARGVLVVEAAPRSGSLITARLAAEQGREVFAIPGSIHSPQSRGCHLLIRQGAKLVEGGDDILEELRMSTPGPEQHHDRPGPGRDEPPAALGGTEADRILDALGWDPLTLDALADRTGCTAAELNARLLELELDGRVARLPGQRFQRIAQA